MTEKRALLDRTVKMEHQECKDQGVRSEFPELLDSSDRPEVSE